MKRLIVALAAGLLAVTGVLYALVQPGPRSPTPAGSSPALPAPPGARAAPPPPAAAAVGAAFARPPVFHGTVVDAKTRKPVAGVRIELCRRHVGGPSPCSHLVADTTTQEDGTFFVDPSATDEADDDDVAAPTADPPTPGALVARADGYGPVIVAGPELERAAEAGLYVLLRSGARLRGRVLLPSREVAEDAEVSWSLPGKQASRLTGVSDDGEYELEDLPEGEIVVAARVSAMNRDPRVGAARVALRVGEERRLDVVLDHPTLVVRGRLIDGQGRPVADASLDPQSDGASDADTLLAFRREGTRLYVDGGFELEYATAGPHRIRFTLDGDGDEDVIAVDSLPATRSDADRGAYEHVVRASRPDLVGCTLLGPDGRPERITRESKAVSISPFMKRAGQREFAVCGCGAGVPRSAVHFLWPREGTAVDITLGGAAGEGSARLNSPASHCEITAQPRRPE